MNTKKKLIVALVIGAAAGISAGLLYARVSVSMARTASQDVPRVELLGRKWVAECEDSATTVAQRGDVIDIVSPKGMTLWFDEKLSGDVKISYQAQLVEDGCAGDRTSDLNCFWMAVDPQHPDNIYARRDWRNGIFGRYYSLDMYYVGYGGNTNSTTRFRKYDGDFAAFEAEKKTPAILKEYTDSLHLLVPNKWNKIEIVVKDGKSEYYFDDELLFEYQDKKKNLSGYFGFRTTWSHCQIKDFKVEKL